MRHDLDNLIAQMAVLTDYVERSTHWSEGGADRHAAKLALKDIEVILRNLVASIVE